VDWLFVTGDALCAVVEDCVAEKQRLVGFAGVREGDCGGVGERRWGVQVADFDARFHHGIECVRRGGEDDEGGDYWC